MCRLCRKIEDVLVVGVACDRTIDKHVLWLMLFVFSRIVRPASGSCLLMSCRTPLITEAPT